ncbi:MAG: TMEM175 family protein [Rhizomicrobium sp.]|nr:TMEM175 family protein [Rhizomicrobium sp.]
MGKSRLEAFSDGVLAIIITIMVLELHVPRGNTLAALHDLLPIFLNYGLSFLYVGIYWNNHHHLLHTVHRVSGGILWANLHLLFWLSLLPFVTGWMGENHRAAMPVALYGVVLLLAATAYSILEWAIIRADGKASLLAQALGKDIKGKLSLAVYAAGVGLAFWVPWASQVLYAAAALMWLIPDRRIEQAVSKEHGES